SVTSGPTASSPTREEIAPPRFNRDLPGTRLLFAPGAVLELPSQLASLGLRRAFVVTTGGRAAALVPPQELLGDALVEIFSAARGMNAMAHAVEAMYAANATEATRDIAEEAAALLARSLPLVVAKGTDLRARTSALAGAHLAGRALDEASMGLHHRICHVL